MLESAGDEAEVFTAGEEEAAMVEGEEAGAGAGTEEAAAGAGAEEAAVFGGQKAGADAGGGATGAGGEEAAVFTAGGEKAGAGAGGGSTGAVAEATVSAAKGTGKPTSSNRIFFMSFCNLCLLAVVGLLGRREVSIKDLLNNVLWSSPWQPIEETKVNALGLKQFVKHYSSWVIPRLWEATLSALGQSWNPT